MDMQLKMKSAIVGLLADEPFFASILLSHAITMDNDQNMMGINGVELKYNAEFVESLTETQLKVVLVHEALHVAAGHHIRLRGKRLDEGNIAADLAINSMIKDRVGFPPDGTVAGQGSYERFPSGKHMEWYYAELTADLDTPDGSTEAGHNGATGDTPDTPDEGEGDTPDGSTPNNPDTPSIGSGAENGSAGAENGSAGVKQGQQGDKTDLSDRSASPKGYKRANTEVECCDSPQEHSDDNNRHADGKPSKGSGSETGLTGIVEPCPEQGVDGAPLDAESMWQMTVARAGLQAEQAGQFPGWLKSLVEGVLEPAQIPWKRALRPFLSKTIRTGQTYRRPSRRQAGIPDAVLPSRFGKGVRKLVFGIDTSCSMSTDVIEQALVEIQTILALFKDAELVVMQWDTGVRDVQRFSRKDFPLDVSSFVVKGRGGTRVAEFLESALVEKPQAVICLTDGCFSWPDVKPSGVPFMWLMTSDREAGFGQVVKIK